MKHLRFVCLLGLLLLAVKAEAQVDSFMVEGRYFKFSIPKDWVLEEKNDSLQNGNDWNLAFRYGVNTGKVSGVIYLKFELYKAPTNSKHEKKSKKISVKKSEFRCHSVIRSYYEKPVGDCYDCQKRFSYFYYDPVGLNTIITSGYSGNCNQKLIPFFSKTFVDFITQFYTDNEPEVNSWQTFNLDSMELRLEPSQISKPVFLLNRQLSSTISLTVLQAYNINDAFQQPYPELPLSVNECNKLHYIFLYSQRWNLVDQNDVIDNCLLLFVETNDTRYRKHLVFCLKNAPWDGFKSVYYENVLMKVAEKFIEVNKINCN